MCFLTVVITSQDSTALNLQAIICLHQAHRGKFCFENVKIVFLGVAFGITDATRPVVSNH